MLKLTDIPEENILFYDIETDSQFAPYCNLKMIGMQVGRHGTPALVETFKEKNDFKARLKDPDVLKVSFNGWSFDNIVLDRHGFPIEIEGTHDVFLMFKTIAPWLAAHSLKFIAWWFTGDPHFPEMDLHRWLITNGFTTTDIWQAPKDILKPYCLHDITQTRNIFDVAWEKVQHSQHWDAYTLDNEAGPCLQEMMMDGGLFLDAPKIAKEIATLQKQRLGWEGEAWAVSNGQVENVNSPKQLGAYLVSEGFELDLTDNGEFSVPKEALLDIIDVEGEAGDKNRVARCAYEIRQIDSVLKYFKNYIAALQDNPDSLSRSWIPKQYSLDGAKTRRTLSNSKYKLNFQNPTKQCKKVHRVPDGYLGVWIDSTQVENVVHIYESRDTARRLAYEAAPDWNEYVWLCNQILGGNRGKKELDDIPSPQFPGWSIYKQFKTIKLALNFGMGIDKFCLKTGVDKRTGKESFALIHQACPAIRELQDRVREDIRVKGFVQDVFGHIYTGSVNSAYKVVAYLVQGTGTGSLPKAQLGAARRTIRGVGGTDVITLAGTTHDECEIRCNLRKMDADSIVATLQNLRYDFTDRYSAKFDGIPLRAKIYLSRTSAYEAEEVDLEKDLDKIYSLCS